MVLKITIKKIVLTIETNFLKAERKCISKLGNDVM